MTILLTGGAGFIGAATAERLLERGERVVVLDNFNDYYPVQLKRGITGSLVLWEWRKEVRDGGTVFPPTRTVTVKLLNEAHDRNETTHGRALQGPQP